MPTLNLGRVGFVNKGVWSGATAYKINDTVTYLGGTYACLIANTGQTPILGGTIYWQEWIANNVVHTVGDETIAGIKTFTSSPIVPNATTAFQPLTFGQYSAKLASDIHAATSKTTPVDADELALVDSADAFGLKKVTFANLKASIGAAKQLQPITASVATNALTVTLNPTSLDFRSATLSDGTINTRTVSSPISMTVSSGSTLGTSNGVSARLVLIAIDNTGTVELAITNLAGDLNLDETTLVSTTAEGGAGAADSINVIYSTSARTNVPFRVVGFIDITEATAGTWATAPTSIQGAGGLSVDRLIKTSNILAEYTVAGAAVTSIDFSGLDINTHGGSYEVEFRLINATASVSEVFCYVNGDTTATNYYHQVTNADNTSFTGARTNNARISYMDASSSTFGIATIGTANSLPSWVTQSRRAQGAGIIFQLISGVKTATVTNITQLTFTASVASSIGIGSKIIIRRKDK